MQELGRQSLKFIGVDKICLFLKVSVIVILTGYTFNNVVQGPFQSYLRNNTMIRRHEIQLSGTELTCLLGLLVKLF